ncbi:MAG: type 1 glutamine amidotransferase [Streptosporangiales bacterium]|nr:type 1 glutamine amidotransferase [Streptosporangiales bacterium]
MTSRILVIEHGSDGGPGRFGPWLADAGVEAVIVRPYAGELLPKDLEHDGLIVLGGAMGATDDERAPWLPGARALLRQAVAAGVPTLGICLGAQLLAVACGGEVARGAAGPELGACPVTVAADGDALLGGLSGTPRFVQWHFDVITVPPPGAVPLASSAMYPVQAFRLGDVAWGVQFHPEVTQTDMATWAASDAVVMRERGQEPREVLADAIAREDELAVNGHAVAAAFAAVVRACQATPAAAPERA